jgi:hypothetical protein
MTAQDPVIDYAVWNAPGSSLTVLYSIPLFHEIDFSVNEGYRRIPHGGLEIGGVLFGRVETGSIRIEAYRPIECEHSMGPSFVLSPRDIESLQEQLRKSANDEELQGLTPLGWFISHSRGELLLSDREAALFDQLFPHREQITILIKPIKFQPTRFSFFVRDPQGKLKRDGTQDAIILPLPGRAGRAGSAEPAPSIAAPAYEPEEPAAAPPPPPQPVAAPEKMAVEELAQPEVPAQPARVEESKPEPPPAPVVESKPPISAPQSKTASAAMPHTLLAGAIPQRRSTDLYPPPKQSRNRGVSILISIVILLLAAGSGFAVGYLAYSRLTFSAISLTVEDHPPTLYVSWPANQSRDADSASIRVDDGDARPLTLEEKTGGQAQIKMSGTSVKVELITHSWFHEERGIVRYVRPAPPVAPAATAPSSTTTTPNKSATPASGTDDGDAGTH